ncbi:MAG: ATP-binding protein [Methylomonas sp.]|nr:ATP-binding protein [Methylomonas sp.]
MTTAPEKVDAHPSKRFFVSMLTRDIELKDAILDLLDNCVDGIERQLHAEDAKEKPYSGFWAKITANKDKFEIWDNCGGIPIDIAKKSAFKMGRDDPDRDAGLHTVGMYGIGMKRALFKMGKKSRVESRPKNEENAFIVEINPEWLESNEWELELNHTRNEILSEYGTRILIEELHDNIAFQFDENSSDFQDDLIKTIKQFYALIIDKGFKVTLNGIPINGAPITLLTNLQSTSSPIDPFIFKAKIDEVDINLAVGFRRRLASESELDEEAKNPRTSDEAGWTIICNDRAVLYCDKSQVTGWGRATVPRYHTQFISIGGVVEFRSNKLMNLPLNTTKRGLDTSSKAYLSVFDYMTEGMKIFTDFTNKWKGREEETSSFFEGAVSKKPREILSTFEDSKFSSIRKIEGAKKYTPQLPVPEEKNPLRRIVFTRPSEDIKTLAIALFEDSKVKPTDVGQRCFDLKLQEVASKRESK